MLIDDDLGNKFVINLTGSGYGELIIYCLKGNWDFFYGRLKGNKKLYLIPLFPNSLLINN